MQTRLTDLQKEAVRCFSSCNSSVNCILPLSGSVFATGSSDGSVRCYDARQPDPNSINTRRSLLGAWHLCAAAGTCRVQQTLLPCVCAPWHACAPVASACTCVLLLRCANCCRERLGRNDESVVARACRPRAV
jgi:hypothetical protein